MDARSKAIERVYRVRYLSFRNALATITGDRESARDVVQEAFARALAERNYLRRDEAIEAWIWRIAFRLALRSGATAEESELDERLDPGRRARSGTCARNQPTST